MICKNILFPKIGFRLYFLFVLLVCSFQMRASYSGNVFIDSNQNGIADRGEKGIARIAVSDGLNVVMTGSDGHFELSGSPRTRFIFITVPSGYKTSKRHYIKVEQNVFSYDFGLLPFPVSAKKSTRFIQIADTEAYGDYGWIQPIREYAANEEVSFIVHTGDICYERGLNFHGENVRSENMGVPVFYCIGNHDLVKGDYGEQLFEQNFGPVYYSFEAGNTHYIVTPMLGGDYKPSYKKEDVYRWMKNDLVHVNPLKSIMVFNHDLLTFNDQFIYGISDTEQINLNNHNLKAWIYGHWHSNYMKKHGATGIVSVCTSPPDKGGIDHSSSNFLVYEMDEKDELTIHPRYNYLEKHLAVSNPNGKQCIVDNNKQLVVSVNFYSTGSPAKSIEFRLNGDKKWVSLKPETDWSWKGLYPVQKLKEGVSYTICFRTSLKNEDRVSSVRNFVFTETKPEITEGVRWTNLLGNPQHRAPADDKKYSGLQLVWTKNAGSNIWMCSPVYANGKVLIATMDEFAHEKNHIVALDAQNGNLIWKYKTQSSVKNNICLDDGKVLATDEEGVAYAVDINNGQLIWRKELGHDYLGSYVAGNVVNDGILYTGFGNYFSALKTTDGAVIWKNTGWRGGEGTPLTHTVAGNTLVTGSQWRALYGHDLNTGTKKWELSKDGLNFRGGAAVMADDTLFVTALKAIVKINPSSGTVYKSLPIPYEMQAASAPLVTDNMIVLGTSTDGLAAFERQTMKELWKVKTGPSLIYTSPYSKPCSATIEASPLPVGNLIVFGASDGFLYAVDQTSGTTIEKIELGSPLLSTACVTGNALFLADFSGNVYCFKLSE
jgi:outer membrane protein assembly factor BamB